MRKVFHQYFKPTETELRELWDHGLFSFDASVLLNVYGYSSETRDKLVDFIQRNAHRVRLPYQFGLEYARNRSSVIVKQVNNYNRVEKALREIRDTDIAPKREHPYLNKKSLKAYEQIQKELEQNRKTMEKLISSDPYAEKLMAMLEGRIGACPTTEEIAQLHAEARERYEKGTPPGFEDLKNKEVPDAYGDYIGWQQLMQIAKAEKVSIILVNDDQKADWWYIERDRTIGPRPELLEEFTRVTNQQFHMYTSESFLRAAKQFTTADIREEVIEEVTMRLASQRESQLGTGLKSIPPESERSEGEKLSAPGEKGTELKESGVEISVARSPRYPVEKLGPEKN
jgi:hypothetical protein